jgi:hypothetical protein
MRVLTIVALTGLLLVGTGAEAVAGDRVERRPPAGESRAARRAWALGRMDDMANERLRCADRFTKPREVETCEADFTRRFRQYNELYLEASRE